MWLDGQEMLCHWLFQVKLSEKLRREWQSRQKPRHKRTSDGNGTTLPFFFDLHSCNLRVHCAGSANPQKKFGGNIVLFPPKV